jgi:hypothetical protein
MKNRILTFVFFVANAAAAFAQVTAGSIPSGTSAIGVNLNLSRTISFTDTTGFLDLDCDGTPDVGLQLVMGMTAIDLPNGVLLKELHNAYTICTDTVSSYVIVTPHNYGDTLCTGNHLWRADTSFGLGCYGTFVCYAPGVLTNQYIGYKKNSMSEVGWIKISFDLMFVPITLAVDTILVLCTATGIEDETGQGHFSISRNPTSGYFTLLIDVEEINSCSVSIFDMTGRKVELHQNIMPGQEFIFGETLKDGMYFVEIISDSSKKVVKLIKQR